MNLREYQQQMLDALREAFRNGKRAVVLYAPTGAGKTETAIALLNAARDKRNRSAILLDRVVLVNQTSERLDKYGIDHGVLQSGHPRWRPYEYIQVCSAQTLERRGKMENVTLLIVDECHATRRHTLKFIEQNPDVKVVGLSATPFTRGLGKTYDGIVSTTTTQWLVQNKYLVPLKVFISREIDMTGAKKVGGEWTDAEASNRAMRIVGDVVTEWISKTHEIFNGPKKTIVFASGVAHGIELSRKFQEHGYKFLCISYQDEDQYKADVIKDFAKPDTDIHGLIATDILTKGFDVPSVEIAVSARPFAKSLSSHIQQLGRVMRACEGKDFGVWMDFSGNYLRFRQDWEDIYENGVHEIDTQKERPKKEPTQTEKAEAKCPKCAVLWEPGWKSCGHCGYIKERQSVVESCPGEMVELETATFEEKQRFWGMLNYKVTIDGWSEKRAMATYHERFGVWPRKIDRHQIIKPDAHFEEWLRKKLAKYLRKVHAIRSKRK